MANIPDASLTIQDGALGIVDAQSLQSAAVGVCSLGTPGTVYSISTMDQITASLGTGALAEYVGHALAVGGGTIIVCPVNGSVAGTCGSVTETGTGTATLVASGAAYDAYRVIVTIVAGGATLVAGTATFTYSLDNGATTSAVIAVPTGGVYAIPGTNVTLTWTYTSGTAFVAGDVYTFSTVAPAYTSSDLNTALTALCANTATWKFVACVGAAATASGQASIATAAGSFMVTQEASYRFAYAILGNPDLGDHTTGDSSLITAYASVSNVRLAVCAGFADVTSVLTGRSDKRSALFPCAARRHKALISEASNRVKSGSLPYVTKLYRDEQVDRGLDAARFQTLRTIVGKQGFFITRGLMMAPTGSDYTFVQNREVMDVACAVSRNVLVNYLGDSLRVNAANAQVLPGAIYEQDARAIDSVVYAALNDALLAPGHVSSLDVKTNRTDNIISTSLLRVRTRVTPLAYANSISETIGFVNPAIQTVNG